MFDTDLNFWTKIWTFWQSVELFHKVETFCLAGKKLQSQK